MIKILGKIVEFLAKSKKSSLEHYLVSKGVKDAAEADHWINEYYRNPSGDLLFNLRPIEKVRSS
jgi:hypothetical protein